MSKVEQGSTLDFHHSVVRNCAKDLPLRQQQFLGKAFDTIAKAYTNHTAKLSLKNPQTAYSTFCLDIAREEVVGNLRASGYAVDFYTTLIQGAVPPHSHLRIATPDGEVAIDFEWREFHPEWGRTDRELPPILITPSENLLQTLQNYGIHDITSTDPISYAGLLPWTAAKKLDSLSPQDKRRYSG